nr:hypothetical protein [uncultured Methanobrevibacter sp.]
MQGQLEMASMSQFHWFHNQTSYSNHLLSLFAVNTLLDVWRIFIASVQFDI